jgi:ribosomal protein L11 methyltransferase
VIRLAVRVRREHAELVLAELLELVPAGVEEQAGDGGTVEYAIYGAPGELPALPDLQAAAGGALVEVSTSEIADDWHERWRAFHGAVMVAAPAGGGAPGVRVRPPWERPAAHTEGALMDVVIDPGQAFGTGAHATTRLCLELLLELSHVQPPPRPPLIDVGAGSGVLAIVATRLGFAPVLALDNDPLSVQAVRENAHANDAPVEARRWDLRRQPLPPLADAVVLANLLRPLLLELAAALTTASGGGAPAPPQLIASGLLREEADEVAAAFARARGMRERARREQGEWAALWLEAS